MKKSKIIIILYIVFSSCSDSTLNQNSVKENTICIDTNLTIHEMVHVDRICTTYYDGKVMKISTYKDSLREGPHLIYHKNGLLADSSFYSSGHRVGLRLKYDSIGEVKLRQNWYLLNGEHNIVNDFFIFNENGIDTSKSNFFKVKVDKLDSENIKFNIWYFTPFKHDTIHVTIGNIHWFYGEVDSSYCYVDTTMPRKRKIELIYDCKIETIKDFKLGVRIDEYSDKEAIRTLVREIKIDNSENIE